VRVLRTLGLPPLAPLAPGALSRLRFDKKRRGATVQLVLLREVGAPEIVPVSLDELQTSLRKLGHPNGLP
jgi:3-dehydroquinate synthetase